MDFDKLLQLMVQKKWFGLVYYRRCTAVYESKWRDYACC